MKKYSITGIFILSIIFQLTASQDIYQNVRGQVTDKLTLAPLPGANVFIPGSDPLIGTITDQNGYFLLRGVEVGRVTITVMYMGYNALTMSNLIVNSGKELIVNFELEEQVIHGEEVVITAERSNKRSAGNSMAAVSSRMFTIEESQRYAGVRNDISRMASNYAGVSTPNDAVNDIVIRGNSPSGLLWRMDGVEIPNPNHFGFIGSTGGPVSMLNNNVLMNSAFMTAAFPAEYSNAFSGVFDLKTRNGNTNRHEFLGQVGFNGFEAGVEGPLPMGEQASYLVNYRYSTLGVFHKLGFEFGTGVAVPDYQDLFVKINLPTKKYGRFAITGMGGKSYIFFNNSAIDSAELTSDFYSQSQDIENTNSSGALILNHVYPLSETMYSSLTLSATGISNRGIVDSLSVIDRSPVPFVRNRLVETNYAAQFTVSKKFSSRHFMKIGGRYSIIGYNLVDSVFVGSLGRFFNTLDESGNTGRFNSFIQWQFKMNNSVTFNTGINYQMITLNRHGSLEPRTSLSWNINPSNRLSLGYGLHSISYPVMLYLMRIRKNETDYVQTLKDLDLQKSHHIVLAYDRYLAENWRLKAEVYYQYIFNTAIEDRPGTFSMLNYGTINPTIPDTLIDGGKGRNLGVEFTLERFLSRGYYFLLTTSLYDSKYRPSNGKWYSTAYDGGYVINALFGKDFRIGKKSTSKMQWLSMDGKLTAAGGQKYTPIDRELSLQNKRTEYMNDLPYSEKFKDFFRIDIRFAYRLEGKRFSHETGVEIQNLTNRKNPFYSYYNPMLGDLETVYQMGLFPMMQYRIVF